MTGTQKTIAIIFGLGCLAIVFVAAAAVGIERAKHSCPAEVSESKP